MRNKETGRRIGIEEFFNPFDRLRVKMICRFIKEKQVGPRDDGFAERHAPLFPSGKRADIPLLFGDIELVHGGFDPVFQVPAVPVLDLALESMMPLRIVGERFIFPQEVNDVVGARR